MVMADVMADGWLIADGHGRSSFRTSLQPEPSAISHQSSSATDTLLLPYQLTQNVRQNSAVPVRDELLGGVDARDRLELDDGVRFADGAERDETTRLQSLCDPGQFVALAARQTER